MEEKILTADLSQVIQKFDDLNKKLENTAKETSNTAAKNTEMNTSILAMNQAVQNLGSTMPGLTSAFQLYKTTQEQVNVACKAFAGNPVGATIQIIATALTVINTIIDKFKEQINSSAELTDKWNEATAALEPILKLANQALSFIVEKFVDFIGVIAKGIEWIGKFTDKVTEFFGGEANAYSKAAEEAKKYAKLQAEIDKETNQRIKERTASEAKQGHLREEIAKAEGEAKVKLLNDLKQEIKLQTDAEIALNKKRIALMKYQQSLGPTSKAELEELARLEAETNRLIGEQGRQIARIEKQIKSTTDSIQKDTETKLNETTKNVEDAARNAREAALKEYQEYIKEREILLGKITKDSGTNKADLQAERKLQDERIKNDRIAQQQSLTMRKETAKKAKETEGLSAKEIYEINKKNVEDTYKIQKQWLDSDLKLKRERIKEDEFYYNEAYTKKIDVLKETLANEKLTDEDRQKYLDELTDVENERYRKMYELQTEMEKLSSEEKIKNFELELQKKHDLEQADKDRQKQEKDKEEEAKKQDEQVLNEYIENAKKGIADAADLIYESFDKLTDPQQKVIDGMLRIADTWANMPKDASKAKKAMVMVGSAISACTSIINSYIAAEQERIQQDLENGKITEEEAKKEFEKTKKVEIAMATISMMQGIAEAIANAMQMGPILGPIIGAINAAAVSAAGIMQISNIKKTTIEGGGNENAGADIPTINTVTDYGASVNPLLDENYDLAILNQTTTTQGDSTTTEQRVYILESDIQDSNNRVEIRENTTTF